jgi:hypothetical protein
MGNVNITLANSFPLCQVVGVNTATVAIPIYATCPYNDEEAHYPCNGTAANGGVPFTYPDFPATANLYYYSLNFSDPSQDQNSLAYNSGPANSADGVLNYDLDNHPEVRGTKRAYKVANGVPGERIRSN